MDLLFNRPQHNFRDRESSSPETPPETATPKTTQLELTFLVSEVKGRFLGFYINSL